MNKKYIQCKLQKADNGDITIVASDETLDRMGEVVPVESWDLKNYKKNPVLLVDHDYKVSNIVGRAKNLKLSESALTFTPEFHGLTQLAKEVEAMVLNDFAPAVSVGFMPKAPTKDGQKITNELLEISFVSVPANPNALALAMKSIDEAQEKQVEEWVQKELPAEPEEDEADPVVETKMVSMTESFADTLAKSMDELAELKEGRVLSGKSRAKITECSTALKQAATLLDGLLEATNGDQDGGEQGKSREPEKEHETTVPKKVPSSVVRALQDINRNTNILLEQLKKPAQS